MSIEFRCNSCSRILRVKDEAAGKKARCPQCGAIVDIPAASDLSEAAPAADPLGGPPAGPSESSPLGSTPFPSFPSSPNPADSAPNPFAEQGAGAPIGAGAAPFGAAGAPFGGASQPSTNPYAAPALGTDWKDTATSSGTGGELAHRRVEMGDLLQTSWDMFQRQFGMAIVMGLVFMGVNIGISIVTNIFVQIGAATGEPAAIIATQLIGQIIGFFGQTWLQFGLALTALRWCRTGQIQVNDYFAVGPYYLRALGMTFLSNLIFAGIALVLCGIPAAIAIPCREEAAIVIAVLGGAVVAIPLIIYLALSFYLASYFILDRNAGVIDSLKLSYQYMSGNRMTMLLTGLVVGLLGLAVIIFTCCLGSMAVVPYGALIASVAYLKITGQPLAQPISAPSPTKGLAS